MAEPNVLLLDEPTNDLDIETLTSVEDLLDGFAGTVVVVSHDRYFLERVCDRVVGLLGDGQVRDLPGGVDEYLALRASSAAAPAAAERVAAGPAADRRQARKELVRLERRLDRLAPRRLGCTRSSRCTRATTSGCSCSTSSCASSSWSATRSRSSGWPSPRLSATVTQDSTNMHRTRAATGCDLDHTWLRRRSRRRRVGRGPGAGRPAGRAASA